MKNRDRKTRMGLGERRLGERRSLKVYSVASALRSYDRGLFGFLSPTHHQTAYQSQHSTIFCTLRFNFFLSSGAPLISSGVVLIS